MKGNFFYIFFVSLLFFVLKNIFEASIIKAENSDIWLSLFLFILPIFFILEVIVRIVFINLMMEQRPILLDDLSQEKLKDIYVEKLNRYTFELEKLGFEKLTDFTYPSVKGLGRLFKHDKYQCLAEVSQVNDTDVFCSIHSRLNSDWFLSLTNIALNPGVEACYFAFMSQPKIIFKRIENASVDLLLTSLIEWRKQVKNKLCLEVVPVENADTYFHWENKKRSLQRKGLSKKSITLSAILAFFYSFKTRNEWLGKYAKLSK